MKYNRLMLCCILLLGACRGASEPKPSQTPSQKEAASAGRAWVDYKRETYGIALGDHFSKSYAILNWHWSALEDPDERMDSTGQDALLSLGEDLICYNGGEWLPALFLETDQGLVTSFRCSMLFELHEDSLGKAHFLKLMGKDIQQLKDGPLATALMRQGRYEQDHGSYVETFELQMGEGLDHDRFEYVVALKAGQQP